MNTPLPSGWFPDPTGRCEYRWFNGQTWTADVSVGGRRFVDPLQPGPGPNSSKRMAGRGLAISSFIIALVSAVGAWVPYLVFLAYLGIILAVVFGLVALRQAGPQGEARRYAKAGLWLSGLAALLSVVGVILTVKVTHEIDLYLHPGPYELTDRSCAITNGHPAFVATIVNNDTKARKYYVSVTFKDQSGTLDTEAQGVNTVQPGGKGSIDILSTKFTTLQPTCEYTVNGPLPFGNTSFAN